MWRNFLLVFSGWRYLYACKVDGKEVKIYWKKIFYISFYAATLFTWQQQATIEKNSRVFSKKQSTTYNENVQDFSRVVFALGIIPNNLWLLRFQHSIASSSVVCLNLKNTFCSGLKNLIIGRFWAKILIRANFFRFVGINSCGNQVRKCERILRNNAWNTQRQC